MPFTTNYKKWDLVLVSFPFTNFTTDKRRPAIVVSPDDFNIGNDVIVAFVTSQIYSPARIGDYQIKYWKESGLPKASMVRMKFATIDKSIIVKTLGRLRNEDKTEIEKMIVSFFSS